MEKKKSKIKGKDGRKWEMETREWKHGSRDRGIRLTWDCAPLCL
jgi:hypothetical protein